MIISTERKFIFIHLYKCGGSSVNQAYDPHMLWSDLVLGTTPAGRALQDIHQTAFGLHKHSTAAETRDVIGAETWDACRSFALVRHPHAVYESLYRWSSKVLQKETGGSTPRRIWLRHQVKRGTANQAFLQWPGVKCNLLSPDFKGFMACLIEADKRQQGLGREPLFDRLSANGSLLVDSIHQLEAVEHFWHDLEDYLGLKLERVHRNQSTEAAVSWDPAHIDYVTHKHAQDFEAFGYTPWRAGDH